MANVIWVYAEILEGDITPTTLEMLTKAAEVGTAEAVLLGPAAEDAAPTLAKYGASKIYRSADPVYQDYLMLPAAETVAGLIQQHQPGVMLFASSYAGRDLVSNLSARLDCGAISDVGDFTLKDGNVEATIPGGGGTATLRFQQHGQRTVFLRCDAFNRVHDDADSQFAGGHGGFSRSLREKGRLTIPGKWKVRFDPTFRFGSSRFFFA